MTKEVTDIQREIEKTREHLRGLERRLHRAQIGYMSRRQRLNQLEAELRQKYPDAQPDRELLSLVGILPYASLKEDKETIREIVAERYA